MRRDALRRTLALVCLGVASSCSGAPTPPDGRYEICWVDFVQLDGIRYLGTFPRAGRAPAEPDLGPRIADVGFRLEGNVRDLAYRAKDGDAAFLAPGTPLYALQGHDPRTRIAARIGDGLRLYEAASNPRANTGGDLLDLTQRVDSIGVFDDDLRPLAVVSRPSAVDSMVRWVDGGRVRQPEPGGSLRYFLAFYFADGQGAVRVYHPETNRLAQWIALPPSFQAALQATLDARGEVGWHGSPLRSDGAACGLADGW